MHYMVFLAIAGLDGLTIAVVGASLALVRGGASPRLCAFSLYCSDFHYC
jgi:hypothetical protein